MTASLTQAKARGAQAGKALAPSCSPCGIELLNPSLIHVIMQRHRMYIMDVV